MGLFDGLRRRLAELNDVREASQAEAATLADVADRAPGAAGSSPSGWAGAQRISVTMLMEHSEEDLRRLDLFQIIGHLDAEGEIANVEQDSFGNLKFDLATLREGSDRD